MQVHEAWLCSASLRLVNGNPGAALASRLGWAGPLPATTLGAQLLELGRLHPQVQPSTKPACHMALVCMIQIKYIYVSQWFKKSQYVSGLGANSSFSSPKAILQK